MSEQIHKQLKHKGGFKKCKRCFELAFGKPGNRKSFNAITDGTSGRKGARW